MYAAAAWEATVAFEFLAMTLDTGELLALSHVDVWFSDWDRLSISKGVRCEILNVKHRPRESHEKLDMRDGEMGDEAVCSGFGLLLPKRS